MRKKISHFFHDFRRRRLCGEEESNEEHRETEDGSQTAGGRRIGNVDSVVGRGRDVEDGVELNRLRTNTPGRYSEVEQAPGARAGAIADHRDVIGSFHVVELEEGVLRLVLETCVENDSLLHQRRAGTGGICKHFYVRVEIGSRSAGRTGELRVDQALISGKRSRRVANSRVEHSRRNNSVISAQGDGK